MHDTCDGSSSGDLLELHVPPGGAGGRGSSDVGLSCRGWRSAEVSAGDRGGAVQGNSPAAGTLTALWDGAAAGDSVKRPGSWPISRHQYENIWKRPRPAVASDSGGDTNLPTEPA